MAGNAGKSSKKKGRNAKDCAAYKGERKHEKSHVRRLRYALSWNPHDKVAVAALKRYATALFMKPETFHELQGLPINWGV